MSTNLSLWNLQRFYCCAIARISGGSAELPAACHRPSGKAVGPGREFTVEHTVPGAERQRGGASRAPQPAVPALPRRRARRSLQVCGVACAATAVLSRSSACELEMNTKRGSMRAFSSSSLSALTLLHLLLLCREVYYWYGSAHISSTQRPHVPQLPTSVASARRLFMSSKLSAMFSYSKGRHRSGVRVAKHFELWVAARAL